MQAILLDANVLIALVHEVHVHHALAQRWMGLERERHWASCAFTQLAFIRLGAQPQIGGEGATPARAVSLLQAAVDHPRHEYWADAPSPLTLRTLQSPGLVGHRQVSDAYLLGLAVARRARMATFDRGLHSFADTLGLAKHIEWIGPATGVQEPAAKYTVRRQPARSGGRPRR